MPQWVVLGIFAMAAAAAAPVAPPAVAETVAATTEGDTAAAQPIVLAQVPMALAASGEVAERTAPDARTKRTRFIIGIDKRVKYTVSTLSAPNRVVVEMEDANIELPSIPENQSAGIVKSLRSGISGPGRLSVVIEVTSPVVVEKTRLDKAPEGTHYHLALEIAPAALALTRTAKAGAFDAKPMRLGVQPPLPKPAEKPSVRAARAFKPVIVIDPGHGGHDTGATKFGTVEKNVVLAFSQMLREKLEKTGHYKVLMTRETDVFVELDERRAFGEKHNANLFIAVHADYASTRARGATIYSLRGGVAEQLKRSAKAGADDDVLSKTEIAKVKNASGDVDAVKDILVDLKRRELDTTQERTSMFARTVIDYMGGSTNMRDDPDQQAAFRVLKTAQFPSVLIELAYVSNKQDAAQLNSDEWRDKVSTSIRTAIDNYFSHTMARLPL
jgi:N-acetylmuramoyl-L-alanine amidase